MRFDRLRLENFKPYADADLGLERGVSVVLGPNGSGKSSLLQASFFALYGARALSGATLEDLITEGENEGRVELWFTHSGEEYHVERRLRDTGDGARTAKCVLETPDGPIEGARDVRAAVADLLRMDADAFVNCAYVRQGEVNKLIHASPGDRQDMIDELLQLGKLETYRERASEARLGVEDVLTGQRELLEDVEGRIDRKESENLHARLNDLESERNEVTEEIARFEGQIEQAEETRDTAVEVLERHEEKREELERLGAEVDDLQETIADTERERDDLKAEVRDHRERIDDLREQRDERLSEADIGDPDQAPDALADLEETDERLRDRIEAVNLEVQEHAGEAERLRERADELGAEATEKRQEAAGLEEEIEEAEATLEERRERLNDLDDEIRDLEARFEDAPVEVGEAETLLEDLREHKAEIESEIADLRADLGTRRERIDEAERLLEAGKCPECGQPVEDSPHVDRLDEDRERADELEAAIAERETDQEDLDERIDDAEALVEAERERDRLRENRGDVEELIADKAGSIDADRERVGALREEADDHESEAAEKRAAAEDHESDAGELREEIAEINERRATLRERRERLEAIEKHTDEIADLADQVDSLRERRESKAELNDERRQRLAEKRDRRADIREEYDEDRIEDAHEEKDRAESYIEQATEELNDFRERRDDLKEQIGAVRNEIEALEDLRERRQALAERVASLESLHDESRRLQETYGDLRAQLRQRNVDVLERMLNETFDLVYENDSYARIELDGSYELTVYQKDGKPLDPGQLSGGERALFNLSLRCAIYRLLAEGIEGAAPLPPLILDEPTVFLDSGHVSRLVDLVESMRDLGVEQIVVVTHDEELIGAADSVIRVEKDPTSNRSSVERTDLDLVTPG